MLKNFLKPNIARPALMQYVLNFKQPQIGLPSVLTRSDEDLGGFSTVGLDLVDDGKEPPFARFHGDLSLDIPEDRPDIVRLGYAMFRTKDLPRKFMGFGSQDFHDWSQFSQVALRVRGDYRKYFINIQSDTPYPTDLYQHRLYLKTPGEWETVTVNLANFVLTNGGVIQHQQRLETDLIRSIGIGLIDGQYGPYQLDIDWIRVQNSNEDIVEDEKADETGNEDMLGISESPMGDSPENPQRQGEQPQKQGTGSTPGKRLSVDD